MLGNITILENGVFGNPGDSEFQVAASATLIYPGEPVSKALGAAVVTPAATNTPAVGTDYFAGIASSTSTNTASAAGKVQVMKLAPGVKYLCQANNTALISTQALYDALVGARVLFDLTAGTYTVLLTDSATNGLVVEQLDITKYPGKVAFSIRRGATYLA
jgi:hypothetical protein